VEQATQVELTRVSAAALETVLGPEGPVDSPEPLP
jgi:hypothetical protein